MSSKRNRPAERREITVERNGKTYRARYRVNSGVVSVESISATVEKIATQLRGSTACHVASMLLIIMIDAGLV